MGRTVFYLCQHGDALAGETNPDRPLSERGTADVCNVAGIVGGGVVIDTIIHSGKTRARQTAELFHERLSPDAAIQEEAGLGPNDPVEDFAAVIASRTDNVMMVGHMPFVGRLASLLLCDQGGPDSKRPRLSTRYRGGARTRGRRQLGAGMDGDSGAMLTIADQVPDAGALRSNGTHTADVALGFRH